MTRQRLPFTPFDALNHGDTVRVSLRFEGSRVLVGEFAGFEKKSGAYRLVLRIGTQDCYPRTSDITPTGHVQVVFKHSEQP